MISSSNDYATALFMLAAEEDKLSKFASDLKDIEKAFDENPDYLLLLSSPAVTQEERTEIIDAAFGETADKDIVNFIKVLCDHGKITELKEAVKDFKALKKSAENRVTAHVYTAVPLSESQEVKLKENLERRLKSTVKIKSVIDKSMLGGIIIKVDGKIIDGSIKEQLQSIKEVISK